MNPYDLENMEIEVIELPDGGCRIELDNMPEALKDALAIRGLRAVIEDAVARSYQDMIDAQDDARAEEIDRMMEEIAAEDEQMELDFNE